jgi:hypothetical protein
VLNSNSVVVESVGKRYPAKVEYVDAELDIALITVDGVLPVSKVFGAQQVAVGSRVFAIGSPLGLENTISEGLLSGMRELRGTTVVQTSAAISNGNSGGGLFDAESRLLGITTFKLKGGENLNFAIDARYLNVIDRALLASGLVRAVYDRKVVREGDEDDLDEKYIESPALTRWFIEQKAADGSPLYAHFYKLFEQATDAGQLFGPGDKEFDLILQNFLAGRPRNVRATQSLSPTSGAGDPYRLACPMYASKDGTFQYDLNLKVEPAASKVNGAPATFTEGEITFPRGKDGSFTAVLNRYSARISISNAAFPSMVTGTCSKVAERQF